MSQPSPKTNEPPLCRPIITDKFIFLEYLEDFFIHLDVVSFKALAPFADRVISQWLGYLTIIPRARMGSESLVHEAEG